MTTASSGSDRHDDATETTLDDLLRVVEALRAGKRRAILGITGAPGSGKSTLGELLAEALEGNAVLVSLDGFHLANEELHRLGLHPRKGAPETFDVGGYVNLLRRLRRADEEVVYAPRFDRGLEESIGSAVPVPRATPLVITEGNYLLLDTGEWSEVAGLLDEVWYVDPGEDVRLDRLVNRHVQFGRSAEEATERSHGSDQRNADLIVATRGRATRVVRLPHLARPHA